MTTNTTQELEVTTLTHGESEVIRFMREGWAVFCLGSKEMYQNDPEHLATDMHDVSAHFATAFRDKH